MFKFSWMPAFAGMTIALCLFLTACGFHLRNANDLPPQLHTIYLETDQPYAPFEQAFREALESANIHVLSEPSQNVPTLKIVRKTLTTTLTNISLSTQVTQYNLSYALTYTLIDGQGTIIIPSETLSTANTYSVSTNQMLGASNQQDQVTDLLRTRMISLLLDRLSASKVHQLLADSSHAQPLT